jgi:hypothetical protein
MWWQPKQPLTDAERRQEIRRLEAVREKLLMPATRPVRKSAECPTFLTASESRSFDTLNLSAQY